MNRQTILIKIGQYCNTAAAKLHSVSRENDQRVSVHQMAPPQRQVADIQLQLTNLLTLNGRKAELAWVKPVKVV